MGVPTTDLWPRLAPLLSRVERPARYLDHEWGAARKEESALSFCMVYPDTYELGQANQAVVCMEELLGGKTYASGEQSVYVDYVKVTPENAANFQ